VYQCAARAVPSTRDLMRLSKKDSRHKDASWDEKKTKTVSRKAQAVRGGVGTPGAASKGGKADGNKYLGNRNR